MLNKLGERDVGHGVIGEIWRNSLDAQLQKRSQEYEEYDSRILEEFRYEQPFLSGIIERLAEEEAKRYAKLEYIEGTEAEELCIEHWKQRFLFICSFMYKCVSVGIEAKWMKENVRLF